MPFFLYIYHISKYDSLSKSQAKLQEGFPDPSNWMWVLPSLIPHGTIRAMSNTQSYYKLYFPAQHLLKFIFFIRLEGKPGIALYSYLPIRSLSMKDST